MIELIILVCVIVILAAIYVGLAAMLLAGIALTGLIASWSWTQAFGVAMILYVIVLLIRSARPK